MSENTQEPTEVDHDEPSTEWLPQAEEPDEDEDWTPLPVEGVESSEIPGWVPPRDPDFEEGSHGDQ